MRRIAAVLKYQKGRYVRRETLVDATVSALMSAPGISKLAVRKCFSNQIHVNFECMDIDVAPFLEDRLKQTRLVLVGYSEDFEQA
jgi:hypothetical protein